MKNMDHHIHELEHQVQLKPSRQNLLYGVLLYIVMHYIAPRI